MFSATNDHPLPEEEPIMSPDASKLPNCLAAKLTCISFAIGSTVWMAAHWLSFYSWCRTAFGMAILSSCGLAG